MRGLFSLWVLLASLFCTSSLCQAQYYPRGVRFNDNFLPNLDEPDKFFILLDGLVDLQKERQGSGNSVFEDTHFHGQILFGGIQVRGGLLIMQDNNERDIKDLTLGLTLSVRRPVFFEIGAGYLTRNQQISTDDGWAINARVGYGVRVVHKINYRIRLRVSGNFTYKTINSDAGKINATQFFPMIGIEFET